MSQGHEISMIAAGAEVATTLPTHTALQVIAASPAHKRLLATRELVKAARAGTFPVNLEVRVYFGVVSSAVLRVYGRLLESELVTFHELAAAAGNGQLLTQTLRAVLADAPDIVTPYDQGASKRAKSYKEHWELWEDQPASLIPGAGGPACGPAVSFTALAQQRAHEAELRVNEYHRLHPLGDKEHYKKWEELQWKIAEMKILSP
jgi:hypothetical protein